MIYETLRVPGAKRVLGAVKTQGKSINDPKDREWARMNRAGECGTPGGTVPLPFRLQTARDVLALLEEQIGLVRNETESGTVKRARTIGYLAGVALKAVEVVDIVGRVEALEAVLKTRTPA